MLSLYRECKEKQDSGSPCYLDNSDKPMTIWVRRFGNKETREQVSEITERLYGAFPRPGDVDDDKINAYWLIEHGVASWENIIGDDDSEEITFTESNVNRVISNPEYFMSINRILMAHAINYENYLQDSAYKDSESLKKK